MMGFALRRQGWLERCVRLRWFGPVNRPKPLKA